MPPTPNSAAGPNGTDPPTRSAGAPIPAKRPITPTGGGPFARSTTTEWTTVHTIQRWVQDWYGLHLHTDRPEWRQIPATAINAAAHAAGFMTALDMTDRVLAAQLAANRHISIDRSVWLLGTARDRAWQAITALAASAHRSGCTSLPTGPNPWWKPVLVREPEVSRKAYPALRSDVDPDTPPRFTAKTAERISLDLSRHTGQRITRSASQDVVTLSSDGHPPTPTARHEPDDDGLYTIGAGRPAMAAHGSPR
jgi:hypothetical protein